MRLMRIKKGPDIGDGSTLLVFTIENTETGSISKGHFTGSEETLMELFKTLESDDLKVEYE